MVGDKAGISISIGMAVSHMFFEEFTTPALLKASWRRRQQIMPLCCFAA
jgi:hypothetical protein